LVLKVTKAVKMSLESSIEENLTEAFGEDLYSEDDDIEEDIDITSEMADEPDGMLTHAGPIEEAIRTKDLVAIDNYSNTLAKSVLSEAILINDIFERDKINVGESKDNEELEKVPSDVDNELSKELAKSTPGYDSYIIEKFLHSKADPIDVSGDVGFDGKEDHFQKDEEMYPGLDTDDAYVQGTRRQATGNLSFNE